VGGLRSGGSRPGDGGRSLGEELLTPTRIYAGAALALRDELAARGLRLGALLHITGGGLPGNLPRLLPQGLGIALHAGSWPVPPIFELLARLGGLERAELRATFNCGVGLAAIVEPAAVDAALELLASRDVPAWHIGEVRRLDELGGERYLELG
jgi:phosphoribosylformylglycinamidine cyclo-ligase